MEPVALAGDLLPGVVRVGEARLGVLVVLGLERLGDPDERLAGLVVDALLAQQDAAQLDRGVAQGVPLDRVGRACGRGRSAGRPGPGPRRRGRPSGGRGPAGAAAPARGTAPRRRRCRRWLNAGRPRAFPACAAGRPPTCQKSDERRVLGTSARPLSSWPDAGDGGQVAAGSGPRQVEPEAREDLAPTTVPPSCAVTRPRSYRPPHGARTSRDRPVLLTRQTRYSRTPLRR